MTAATLASNLEQGSAAPQERLGRILHGGEFGGFRAVSDVAACLLPLLSAIGWSGHPRNLSEALPHFAETLDIDGLRSVLANLNYSSRPLRLRLSELDPRLAPCLFLPDQESAMVVLAFGADGATVFCGETSSITKIDPHRIEGVAYFFSPSAEGQKTARSSAEKGEWFAFVARRFRRLVLQMLAMTSVMSLLALAVPIYIMSLYDRVIPTGSNEVLAYLAVGVLAALSADMAIRVIRARLLGYVGARIDMILGAAAFEQIMHLPIAMTERAPIGAQVSRLKQFEAVREFFIGPLAGVVMELPFLIIFIAVIAIVAGSVAWVPVILVLAFTIAGFLIVPVMRRAVAESGEARSRRQSFLIETLTHFRSIKNGAVEPVWSERHRELSARSSLANFRTTQISVVVQTIAQTLMLTAGIATIALGTMNVLNGTMTMGALVASMALIWRVLSPLQIAFLSLTRIEQVKLGIRQVNQLMALKLEREPGQVAGQHRKLAGAVSFQRVSLRYTPNAEPALLGVELDVEPGEVIAVTGPSSSGKSTLLKLVAGLYQPQAGAVLIDGIDIRQLDVGELRSTIAYAPQVCHLFHGTIAQNLRLANPTASDGQLAKAVLDAGLLEDILALPEGFETRLTDQVRRHMPTGLRQRLTLARAYVKDALIYIFDEPGANLDDEGDACFMRKLQELRGHATVFVVTHRPSHMRLADRVVYMHGGKILVAGPPDQILPKLQAA